MRIFVDMDGVVVDFDRYTADHKLTPRQVKDRPGAYLEMEPIPGALDALRQLIADGFEVWLATKPPTGIPWAYADKVSWVMRHIPELQTRVILTHDKGLLGSVCDILVDDRPWRANCEAFPGTLLQFGASGFDWPRVIQFVRMRRETAERATSHYATPLETPADILAAGLLVERYMGMTHQGHWVLGGIQKLDSAGGARIAHNRRGATWMQVNARYVDTAPPSAPAQPANDEVVFIDGVGAGRNSIKSCRDGVQWIVVGDRVYWPLSDSDAKRLRSACCGNGSFDGPATPAAVDEAAAQRLADAAKGDLGWSHLNPQARVEKARRYLALAAQQQGGAA